MSDINRFESGVDADTDRIAERLREAADSAEAGGLQEFSDLEEVEVEEFTEVSLSVKYIKPL